MTTPWIWDEDGQQVLPELHDWKLDYTDTDCIVVNRNRDGQVERFCDFSPFGSEGWSFGRTREHFPELYQWRLVEAEGAWRVENVRRDGTAEIFHNLCFHGGRGLALEMRIFTKDSLEHDLRTAGLTSIEFDNQDDADFGIIFPQQWSYPIVARKVE